ncbi:MAG: chemotaxis protein CheW [Candidatus Woesearchaeota archaeon]
MSDGLFGRVKGIFKKEESTHEEEPSHKNDLTEKIEGISFGAPKQDFRKIVLFKLNEKDYGLDIRYIEEVLPSPSYQKLVTSDPNIEGVIPLNNRMIGVINLSKKLGYENSGVLSRVLVTDFNGELFGLRVDGVEEVIDVLPEDLGEIKGEDELSGYCEGIIKRDGKDIPILDLNKIVLTEDIQNTEIAMESGSESGTTEADSFNQASESKDATQNTSDESSSGDALTGSSSPVSDNSDSSGDAEDYTVCGSSNDSPEEGQKADVSNGQDDKTPDDSKVEGLDSDGAKVDLSSGEQSKKPETESKAESGREESNTESIGQEGSKIETQLNTEAGETSSVEQTSDESKAETESKPEKEVETGSQDSDDLTETAVEDSKSEAGIEEPKTEAKSNTETESGTEGEESESSDLQEDESSFDDVDPFSMLNEDQSVSEGTEEKSEKPTDSHELFQKLKAEKEGKAAPKAEKQDKESEAESEKAKPEKTEKSGDSPDWDQDIDLFGDSPAADTKTESQEKTQEKAQENSQESPKVRDDSQANNEVTVASQLPQPMQQIPQFQENYKLRSDLNEIKETLSDIHYLIKKESNKIKEQLLDVKAPTNNPSVVNESVRHSQNQEQGQQIKALQDDLNLLKEQLLDKEFRSIASDTQPSWEQSFFRKEQDLHALRAEIASLKSQDKQGYESELRAIRDELKKGKTEDDELEALREEISSLKQNQTKGSKDDELKALREELASLKSEMNGSEVKALRDEVASLKERQPALDSLHSEMGSIKETKGTIIQAIKDLRDEIVALKTAKNDALSERAFDVRASNPSGKDASNENASDQDPLDKTNSIASDQTTSNPSAVSSDYSTEEFNAVKEVNTLTDSLQNYGMDFASLDNDLFDLDRKIRSSLHKLDQIND